MEDSKGRGRGILRSNSKGTDVEVEGTKYMQEPCTFDRLSGFVDAVSLDTDNYELIAIKHTIKELAVDMNSLDTCIKTLLDRCFVEWKFAKSAVCCAVTCCGDEGLKSIEEVSFKQQYLKQLQLLYKQKETLQAERPPKKWLACVSLLSQTWMQLTRPDGLPMEMMKKPAVEVLEMCLSKKSSVEEIECVAKQLADVATVLVKSIDPVEVKRFQNAVRDVITEGRGSQEARLELIDVLECFAQHSSSI